MDIEIILYIVAAVLITAVVVGPAVLIAAYFYFKGQYPGFAVFRNKKCTPILDVVGDNTADWVPGEKSMGGSILYNPNTPTQTVDQAIVDNKPSLFIGGVRAMLRVRLTPLTIDPKDAAHVQLVINFMDDHKLEYPKLSALQDYEWAGAITHDQKTARECLLKYCIVEPVTVDANGVKHEKSDKQIQEEQQRNIQEYVNEIARFKSAISKEVYVDLARVVNFTQCKIRAAALNVLWSEMEKLVRYELERKYAGMKGGIPWWSLLLAVLGGFITAVVCFEVMGL